MSFGFFKSAISRKIALSGERVHARFSIVDGSYIADCSNGVRISGNSTSRKVTIAWGSGHIAQSYI